MSGKKTRRKAGRSLPAKENRPKPEKITIVEDEIIVAMGLRLRLQRLGYEVIGTFSTAEEAVPACVKTHTDIVLMDFILKGKLDGFQATELIHSLCNTPLIMLSAQPESTGPVEPDSYLVKPSELFGKCDRECPEEQEKSLRIRDHCQSWTVVCTIYAGRSAKVYVSAGI